MTPSTKAHQLKNDFGELAEKVVDEIQQIKSVYHDVDLYDYWEEVRKELEKIK